jgi:hypothetical protein
MRDERIGCDAMVEFHIDFDFEMMTPDLTLTLVPDPDP